MKPKAGPFEYLRRVAGLYGNLWTRDDFEKCVKKLSSEALEELAGIYELIDQKGA